MMEQYEYYKTSIIGVQEVSRDEVSRYGIVDGEKIEERLYSVRHLIEKPKTEEVPFIW